ncbi:hypothetical protein B0H16DRAFT_1885241 [Mycena metata]|uniref:BTB domain-containing protein n=1 Tax=Mycena metata TaxID=1033252 RepID=A0AAD7J909_9AGAR|nr:hypothetical protein B0H16DRAFT_1885241 [Mycena metata]
MPASSSPEFLSPEPGSSSSVFLPGVWSHSGPASDLVIRSDDGVDFHVHKDIMSMVSPVFKSMLQSYEDRLDLPDSKKVLDSIIYLIYFPAYAHERQLRTSADLDGIWEVHQATRKYELTGPRRILEYLLLDPALVQAHPYRLFAIARLCTIPQLDMQAAMFTLEHPVCPPLSKFPELWHLPAEAFHNIYGFHHLCSERAEKVVEQTMSWRREKRLDDGVGTNRLFVWWQLQGGGHTDGCGAIVKDYAAGGHIQREMIPAEWFRRHIEAVALSVKGTPSANASEEAALEVSPSGAAAISRCSACHQFASMDLEDYARQLRRAVEQSNDAVWKGL